MVKKLGLAAIILFCFCSLGRATHRYGTNADNITSGTLGDARLSVNVTTQGQLNDGSKVLIVSSVTAYGTFTSSSGFRGGTSTFTAISIGGLTQTAIGISSGSQTVDAFHIKNTGVSAGQYGGTFSVPVITVDAGGRVTSISNTGLPTSSTNSITPFNFVLGALTDPNATVSSNTVDGLNEVLRLCGASGLTTSSTATCTIAVRPGLYDLSGSTIPAGVTFYSVPGSSINFTHGATGSTVAFTVYGTILNGVSDMNNTNLSRPVLDLRSNSTVKDFAINNTLERHNKINLVTIKNSTNSFFSGSFDNYLSSAPVTDSFDSPLVLVDTSTGCYVSVTGGSMVKYGANTTQASPITSIVSSSRIRFENSRIKNGRMLAWISGGNNNSVSNNEIFVTTALAAGTAIQLHLDPATTSYAHVIESNRIIVPTNVTVTGLEVIKISQDHNAVIVRNNFVYGKGFTRFILNAAGAIATVIKGNDIWETSSFISDAGTGTKYTGIGNFLGGVEQ